MIKNKQAIHGLRSEKLRKIRYELRTLLRLEYNTRWEEYSNRLGRVDNDTDLTPSQQKDQRWLLIRERVNLTETRRRYPINCIICGDRMRNLAYYPQYGWLCSLCELDYK